MDEAEQRRPSRAARLWTSLRSSCLATRRVIVSDPTVLLWPLLALGLILGLGIWGVTAASGAYTDAARAQAGTLAAEVQLWLHMAAALTTTPLAQLASLIERDPQYGTVKAMFANVSAALMKPVDPHACEIRVEPWGVAQLWHSNLAAFGMPSGVFQAVSSTVDPAEAARLMGRRTGHVASDLSVSHVGTGDQRILVLRLPVFVAGREANETFGSPQPPEPCGDRCAYFPETKTKLWGYVSLLLRLSEVAHGEAALSDILRDSGFRYTLWALGTVDGAPAVASAQAPRDPMVTNMDIYGLKWTLHVAPHNAWTPAWYGGLVAGVVILAVAVSGLLFAVLVSRHKHKELLEALLPRQVVRTLATEPHMRSAIVAGSAHRILSAESPADLMLSVMSELLEGGQPNLRDIMYIRTALLGKNDIYQPINLRGHIKDAGLDAEVAQSLMRQLGGGGGTAAGMSFIAGPSRRPAPRHVKISATGSASGGPTTPRSLATLQDGELDLSDAGTDDGQGGGGSDTLPSVLALILTPHPLGWPETYASSDGAAEGDGTEDAASQHADGGGAAGGGSQTPRETPASRFLGKAASFLRVSLAQGSGGSVTARRASVAERASPQPSPRSLNPMLSGSGRRSVDMPSSSRRLMLPSATAASPGPSGSGLAGPPSASRRFLGLGLGPTAVAPDPAVQRAASMQAASHTLGPLSADPMDRNMLGKIAPALNEDEDDTPEPTSSCCGASTQDAQHEQEPVTASAVDVNDCAAQQVQVSGVSEFLDPLSHVGTDRPSAKKQSSVLAMFKKMSLNPISSSNNDALVPQHLHQQSPQPTSGRGPRSFTLSRPPSAVSPFTLRAGSQVMAAAILASPTPAAAAAAGGDGSVRPGGINFRAMSARYATQGLAETAAVMLGGPPPASGAPRRVSVAPPPAMIEETERLLAMADGWQFDTWRLQEATQGHALSSLGFFLMQRAGLVKRFRLKPMVLARLLRAVEAGYLDNPYHGATHAADVLQTLHVIIHATQLHVHYLDPLGLLAAYYAAIVHDYAHPGLTSDFLVATSDPLAIRYNDKSPLENHHCAASFSLLQRPELNVLAPLSQPEKTAFRKQVIELVLSTDMKQHFSILSHFNTVHRLSAYQQQALQQQQQQSTQQPQARGAAKQRQSLRRAVSKPRTLEPNAVELAFSDMWTENAPKPVDDTERLLSLQMALKCADIGHLGEELPVHKRWLSVLEEEFFRQGDREKELGLPISPLFDRSKQGVSKSQVGFYDFVALPLVHALASAFPGAQQLKGCFLTNYNHWRVVDGQAPVDVPKAPRRSSSDHGGPTSADQLATVDVASLIVGDVAVLTSAITSHQLDGEAAQAVDHVTDSRQQQG
ncbi:hypothetical protein HYH03_011028 [Edaphochlamys debaryana]|uniref:PDEase domain-containing protein n=1 Tax=Edaphochlamys debaryana TaxID=47281 RepID=A0A835XSZ0_9CHLO|nr:hypothetical protein HYH03_011028 [Edaphochlamys debaryana]|eukprot:KAG2490637.1 hypothetical protein HYH03_011028 [Edaphochlamys debaryana]